MALEELVFKSGPCAVPVTYVIENLHVLTTVYNSAEFYESEVCVNR